VGFVAHPLPFFFAVQPFARRPVAPLLGLVLVFARLLGPFWKAGLICSEVGQRSCVSRKRPFFGGDSGDANILNSAMGGRPFPAPDHHPASRRDVATCTTSTARRPTRRTTAHRLCHLLCIPTDVAPLVGGDNATLLRGKGSPSPLHTGAAAEPRPPPNLWRCTGREFRWVRHGPTSRLTRCRAGLACFPRRGPRGFFRAHRRGSYPCVA
jgi:hypothetical protein